MNRITGFDLARAYAIFGMFIVNFNFCFGSVWATTDPIGRFLNLFVGNSTAIFIISAGMGVSLMTYRHGTSTEKKEQLKTVIIKRSIFLFTIGLLLFVWWPGDILHFYGGYMHVAAFLLFVRHRYLLAAGIAAILIFHLLLLAIPVETGWDFSKFQPVDFWTPVGFIRNTFYNGWNAIFPWLAYFVLGMYLGRLDWRNNKVKVRIFIFGAALFTMLEALRIVAKQGIFSSKVTTYIMSEYFPAYLPFMIITSGFALMVITVSMVVGEKFEDYRLVKYLAVTGRMTLSHYIIHLTLGMLILSGITGLKYTGNVQQGLHEPPLFILLYSVGYFLLSVCFSMLWSKRFKTGPLEGLMRAASATYKQSSKL